MDPDPVEMSQKMLKTIKERAVIYTNDNLRIPTDFERILIENAMIIGASIAIELHVEAVKIIKKGK